MIKIIEKEPMYEPYFTLKVLVDIDDKPHEYFYRIGETGYYTEQEAEDLVKLWKKLLNIVPDFTFCLNDAWHLPRYMQSKKDSSGFCVYAELVQNFPKDIVQEVSDAVAEYMDVFSKKVNYAWNTLIDISIVYIDKYGVEFKCEIA